MFYVQNVVRIWSEIMHLNMGINDTDTGLLFCSVYVRISGVVPYALKCKVRAACQVTL